MYCLGFLQVSRTLLLSLKKWFEFTKVFRKKDKCTLKVVADCLFLGNYLQLHTVKLCLTESNEELNAPREKHVGTLSMSCVVTS